MLTKILLVVALSCPGITMDKIQAKLHSLESQNPGSKVTLRLDRKVECSDSGEVIQKHRETKSLSRKGLGG
jgi:hypothetical protein